MISKTADKDVFKLKIAAGDINIIASPYWITPKISQYPDLNIKLRLLSSTGTELASADVGATPNTYASMASTLTKTGLAAGTYYIEMMVLETDQVLQPVIQSMLHWVGITLQELLLSQWV